VNHVRTIVGIDCGTTPAKRGAALAEWEAGRWTVLETPPPEECRRLVERVAGWLREGVGPALIALDAPLGWPDAMRQDLPNHRAGDPIRHDAGTLFSRATDHFVRDRIPGTFPLEVGAAWIARTAHWALRFLSALRQELGEPIPLAWAPSLSRSAAIEVYPAATLRSHGWFVAGLKKDDACGMEKRSKVLDRLVEQMDLGPEARNMAEKKPDIFDAVICVQAALDFLSEECYRPPVSDAESDCATDREGWIWVKRAAD
jgi:predicted nuclease with RNAse H fold